MDITETFCPIDYSFRWTEDWYEYDADEGGRRALAARCARVEELRAAGHLVRVSREGARLKFVFMGGIGTGHPPVTLAVPVYTLMVVA